jgi:hypothetical protein
VLGPENVVLVMGKNNPPAWVAGRLPCDAVAGPENVVLVTGKNVPPAWVAGRLPCDAAVLGPENVVLVTGKNNPPAWVAGGLPCAAAMGPEKTFDRSPTNWAAARSIPTTPVNENATRYFVIRTVRIIAHFR